MIIDLQSISRSPRCFDLSFEPGWWRQSENGMRIRGLDAPLSAEIHVSREGGRYVISGRLAGRLRLVCDRCLDAYTLPLCRGFRLSLRPALGPESIQDETELKKEDLAVGFIEAGKIDLDDIIREQIYLSLPMKLLCGSVCAGLCSRCGVNLNRETCNCSGKGGHPAFRKLKELSMR